MLFRSNALDLVEELELAEMKGEIKRRVSTLAKFDELIIDEPGDLLMAQQASYNRVTILRSLPW